MSTDVTMQELELEHAELLPSRETLHLRQRPAELHLQPVRFRVNGNANQVAAGGSGNGGFISVLNGNAVNVNIL